MRLCLVAVLASALAIVLAHFAHRHTSFGFYAVGAFVLGGAVFSSTSSHRFTRSVNEDVALLADVGLARGDPVERGPLGTGDSSPGYSVGGTHGS